MNILFKRIYRFGDKLEDRVRRKLSHYPITYAFVGGMGIIIFWRGIWHSMDYLVEFFSRDPLMVTTGADATAIWWDGPLSIVVGTILLLMSGLFVTSFIGNEIIISGIKGEKRLAEKTEQEIEDDAARDAQMMREIDQIVKRLDEVEKKIEASTKL